MRITPQTRVSLLQRLHQLEDAEAWIEFTDLYQPLIYDICRQKGLQHADATDISQEVLGKVAAAIDQYDPDRPNATFRGWLYRMTRNLVVDFFRRRHRDPLTKAAQVQHVEFVEFEATDSEFDLGFRRRVFAIVAQCVQRQVQPNTWQAFWKTEVEGIDSEEAARQLNMTRGALYVARSRVLAKLRSEVEKRLAETQSPDLKVAALDQPVD